MIVKILVAFFQILLLMGSIQVYCMPLSKKIPVKRLRTVLYISKCMATNITKELKIQTATLSYKREEYGILQKKIR